MPDSPRLPGPGGLTLAARTRRDVRVLVVEGDLDLLTRGRWERAINEALADARPGAGLVVDMAAVGFCDAGCAGVLIAAARRRCSRVGAAITVAAPTRIVARVLDILAPDGVPPRFTSVTEAAAMLASHARHPDGSPGDDWRPGASR